MDWILEYKNLQGKTSPMRRTSTETERILLDLYNANNAGFVLAPMAFIDVTIERLKGAGVIFPK